MVLGSERSLYWKLSGFENLMLFGTFRYTVYSDLGYPAEFLWASLNLLLWAIPAVLMISVGFEGPLVERSRAATYAGFLLCGAVFWNYVEAVWTLCFYLREAMVAGILEAIWVTPMSRVLVFAGWSLARVLTVTVQSVVGLALVVALVGWGVLSGSAGVWSPTMAAEVIGIGVVSLVASYGFAFALAGLSLLVKDVESLFGLLGNAAPLLGGMAFTVSLLPTPLRIVGYLFPFTWGLDLIRGTVFGSRTILPWGAEATVCVGLSLFWLMAGYVVLLLCERAARYRGLGTF